jgi:GrpB-like predicted nucleotidyltransferase (UPF0157 family)/quercetin dioxygenase-like cupin family protein
LNIRAIEIERYSPDWAVDFDLESGRVAAALGDVLVAIHHVGSTSVPGCDAKPIIDMLAVVADLARLDASTPQLESLGYEAMGEFGIPGRRYFRKGSAFEDRTHQIHAFEEGSSEIDRHLAFRDFLRAHPEAAAEYVALKRRLAATHPNDVAAYTEGKTDFIRAIEARSLARKAAEEEGLMANVVHVIAGGGAALESGSDLIVLKGTGGQGIGSLMFELTCPPGGGPPPHTDPSEELIYILEGTFEFVSPTDDGVTTYLAHAGDAVIIPKRAPHTYRNVGTTKARMVVFFRDNEHMQPFFEELGIPVEDPSGWTSGGMIDFERALAIAAKHGIEPLIPPPGSQGSSE